LKSLLVMKFGGTSVGSADRMRVAARLSAEQRKKRPLVIVVSAMSGVTDLLLDATKHAEAGDPKGLRPASATWTNATSKPAGSFFRGPRRKARAPEFAICWASSNAFPAVC
jgi:aspartokinase